MTLSNGVDKNCLYADVWYKTRLVDGFMSTSFNDCCYVDLKITREFKVTVECIVVQKESYGEEKMVCLHFSPLSINFKERHWRWHYWLIGVMKFCLRKSTHRYLRMIKAPNEDCRLLKRLIRKFRDFRGRFTFAVACRRSTAMIRLYDMVRFYMVPHSLDDNILFVFD